MASSRRLCPSTMREAVVQKPLHAFAEPGQTVNGLVFQHLNCQQRNEPDQGTNGQAARVAIHQSLVIVEAVPLVPQAGSAQRIDRVRDGHEMFEELRGDILIGRIFSGQLQGHGKHRQAVERHPGRCVRLLQAATARQRPRTVDRSDVVQPQEAAGENVPAGKVLAIDPPGEVNQQFVKDTLQK
jgi:hypothetical protein